MILAYNTNGLAHHNLLDAISLLADIGYQGVAITLDHHALNPYDKQCGAQVSAVSELLARYQLRSVIETGARFLLDPVAKHEPTLVTSDPAARARRVDFLGRAIDIAAQVNADCVSLWSGAAQDGAGEREVFSRLTAGLAEVLDVADQKNVRLAFEPEPGMFIDSLARYGDVLDQLSARQLGTERLGLTIDIGHLHCQREVPIAEYIECWANRLINLHIEDMRVGVHEHLMFGHGEIDFPPVLAALRKIGYAGLVSVELSRHSHEGPAAARQAYNFLRPLLRKVSGVGCQVSENLDTDT